MSDHPGRVIDAVDFYWGANGGQSRKALALNDAPHIMVNYTTQSNQPLPSKHNPRPYTLWWDCGGSPASFLRGQLSGGDYVTSDAEYIDHVVDADDADAVRHSMYTLRDYPCEPEILKAHGRSIEDHQRMTTERARSLLAIHEDRGVDATPVTAIQGWTEEDYVRHIDALRDAEVMTDYVGIGSVCAREDKAEVARIILRVREELPSRIDIHAFGIKGDALRYAEVADALTSADSDAYDYAMSRIPSLRADGESYRWTDAVNVWSTWRGNLAQKIGTEEFTDASTLGRQTTLGTTEADT